MKSRKCFNNITISSPRERERERERGTERGKIRRNSNINMADMKENGINVRFRTIDQK
jgi:hypothetical protein